MSDQRQYYHSNALRQQVGPLTRAQLQQAMLAPDWYGKAMIWCDGWEKWLPWREAAAELGLTLPAMAELPSAAPPPLVAAQSAHDRAAYAPAPSPATPTYEASANSSGNFYAPPQSSVQTLHGNESVVYAPFWIRTAAYFLDRFVVTIIMLGLLFAVGAFTFGTAAGGDPSDLGTALFLASMFLGGVLIPAAYFIYFEQSESGATPGKRLFGLRVVDAQGGRITLGASFLRNFVAAISATFYNVGHLVAAFTERHQALHDLAATTFVIQTFHDEPRAAGQAPRRKGWGMGAALTIILLCFLIPILAILAAIAIPAYQDYVTRTQSAMVISDSAAPQKEV